MFKRALYFFILPVLASLFLRICQTAGKIVDPTGTSDLKMTVKFPFSNWSLISFSIPDSNSFRSGSPWLDGNKACPGPTKPYTPGKGRCDHARALGTLLDMQIFPLGCRSGCMPSAPPSLPALDPVKSLPFGWIVSSVRSADPFALSCCHSHA